MCFSRKETSLPQRCKTSPIDTISQNKHPIKTNKPFNHICISKILFASNQTYKVYFESNLLLKMGHFLKILSKYDNYKYTISILNYMAKSFSFLCIRGYNGILVFRLVMWLSFQHSGRFKPTQEKPKLLAELKHFKALATKAL